jgi:hypothetical protein
MNQTLSHARKYVRRAILGRKPARSLHVQASFMPARRLILDKCLALNPSVVEKPSQDDAKAHKAAHCRLMISSLPDNFIRW